MKCPSCTDAVLTMADRQGVEIDYCPQCRGVWLDRGELDKLIERAAAPGQNLNNTSSAQTGYREDSGHRDAGYRDGGYQDGRRHQQHRKKSWLSDIFD
jgi:uncharacterized protein